MLPWAGLGLLTVTHGSAGMLAADGRCKVLDAAADGYVRSENCIVMVLEAADDNAAPCRAILRGSAVGQVCALRVYNSLQCRVKGGLTKLHSGPRSV